MGLFMSKEDKELIRKHQAAERQRVRLDEEEKSNRQAAAAHEEYLKTHSAEIQEKHQRYLDSGLAIHEYTDKKLDALIDVELSSVYDSMPGAWTGLALTLTGNQSSNEIINTLRVMITQNSVLIKQNEMILRELRRAREEES